MTLSSQHYLVITALGADRPGIVNTITRHVSSCGCNIEDSRLAMLGEEFTFIMLLSGSWNAITLIESTLPLKGAELDLLIVMKRTTARPRPPMPASVWVQVDVADSPHLIERFTALFDAHHMNIAELVSRTQPAEMNGLRSCIFRSPPTAPHLRTQQILSKRSKPYVQNSMHKAVLTSSIIPNMMNRMELSNESTESR